MGTALEQWAIADDVGGGGYVSPGVTGKGADLERRIEQFLGLHGYRCRRNAVLEGRSGARHEVDVLAERSDGATSFLLGVECKAWNLPIEKDVVAKLAFVLADLGLNKGIVVSLEGWRLGAERSAGQLGIELWGPAELEARLGQVALSQLRSGPVRRLGTVLPLHCAPEAAERLVGRESRGRLGLERESVEWMRTVWVPYHLVEIVTAELERGFLQRAALRSTWRWNLYDGLAGQLASSSTERLGLVEG
ncbi:MAG: restriction endonuclease, partial [Acidimicrobiia bacterium]